LKHNTLFVDNYFLYSEVQNKVIKTYLRGNYISLFIMRDIAPEIPENQQMIRLNKQRSMAVVISFTIVLIAIILSLERNPDTGAIRMNSMIIIIGILAAVFIFLALNPKTPPAIPKTPIVIPTRPCLRCGRPVPMDGIICPYCGFDFRKKMDQEE
jgi:hypothetical protein